MSVITHKTRKLIILLFNIIPLSLAFVYCIAININNLLGTVQLVSCFIYYIANARKSFASEGYINLSWIFVGIASKLRAKEWIQLQSKVLVSESSTKRKKNEPIPNDYSFSLYLPGRISQMQLTGILARALKQIY